MSNDYGNYSRELAKAREGFNETSRKMKESYDKSIKDTQDTSVRKEEELKRNHSTDKERLIAENQDKLRIVSDKTNEILDRKQKEFLDGLKEEREGFNVEKNRVRDNFQTSLINVKDSYTQSLDEFKLQSERLARDNEFKYLQSLQQNKNNTDKKIVEIQKKTDSMISKNNLDLTDQKAEILLKNQKDLELNNRGHKDVLDKKTGYFNRKIGEIVETKDDEIGRQAERYDGVLYKLKEDNNQQIENMITRYEDHSKDMLNNFQNNFNQQESDNINEKNAIRAQLNKDVYNVKRESALMEDKNLKGGSGTSQKALIQDNYERRLDNIRRQMTDQAVNFQRESAESNNQAQVKLKNRDLENRMHADKKEDEFFKEYSSLERKSKEQESQAFENFATKLNDQETNDTKKLNLEQDLSKTKLANQKEEFGKTVNKLAEMNVRNVEKLQEESAKEKAEIVKVARKQYSENLRDLRDGYRVKHESTLDSFSKKLDFKENEVNQVKEQSETAIQKIQDQANKMVKSEVEYNQEVRDSYQRTMREELADVKRNYQTDSKRLKSEYDLSLQKIKRENDLMLARMSKKNNEDLARVETGKNKEFKRLSNDFKQQYERLAKDSRMERESMVEHYERRIQELKNMYEMEKIKERDVQAPA